jgi:hypothetical protein
MSSLFRGFLLRARLQRGKTARQVITNHRRDESMKLLTAWASPLLIGEAEPPSFAAGNYSATKPRSNTFITSGGAASTLAAGIGGRFQPDLLWLI